MTIGVIKESEQSGTMGNGGERLLLDRDWGNGQTMGRREGIKTRPGVSFRHANMLSTKEPRKKQKHGE